jgi:hypothetical protein
MALFFINIIAICLSELPALGQVIPSIHVCFPTLLLYEYQHLSRIV